MADWPRISIVTASYNQGRFLGRTIESVLAQNYPNLEHVVVDGLSRDETPEVLARYPHLRVIRERDKGQADAINKGFRTCTGALLGFLNSDDTLAPGALHRVAQEIDPARGRHVVMGRCLFVDEDDRPNGMEHPSLFAGHHRVLEIWKGHAIPQPATFWTREAWSRCGPLDEREPLVLDYDLFCRMSRAYRFHVVDQVLAHYRLHASSKTCSTSNRDVLEESIRVSKRYWGPKWSPSYWRLAASLARFRLGRRQRGMALLKQARDAWGRRRRVSALASLAGSLALAPDVMIHVGLMPALARKSPPWYQRLAWLDALVAPRSGHSETLAWQPYDRLHSDGWAGPVWRTSVEVQPGQSTLIVEGSIEVGHHREPLTLELTMTGRTLARYKVGRGGPFTVTASVAGVAPGRHELQVTANGFLVLHDFRGNGDFRPVAFKLRQLRLAA